jgi:hypothetical protein
MYGMFGLTALAAALLLAGQVLVAGGRDTGGNALASAELYYYPEVTFRDGFDVP